MNIAAAAVLYIVSNVISAYNTARLPSAARWYIWQAAWHCIMKYIVVFYEAERHCLPVVTSTQNSRRRSYSRGSYNDGEFPVGEMVSGQQLGLQFCELNLLEYWSFSRCNSLVLSSRSEMSALCWCLITPSNLHVRSTLELRNNTMFHFLTSHIIIAALRSKCGHYQQMQILYYCPVVSSFFLLFSSPNLSGRRLDVYHSSTHGVALVQI